MKMPLRRGLVATAVTALGVGLLATPAAQADTSRTPQTVNAADWLSSQVVDGQLYNEQFDFVDWGLTLDTLLALDAVGGYNGKVADIADALEVGLADYIGTGEEKYAGATAKSLVSAQAAGRNAASFGPDEADLVALTEARVDDTTGRLADQSAFGNFANVFGQAFAVKGLHAAESAESAEATAFLLQQQCANGGFRLTFSEADATCSDDADAQNDSTSLAIDALASQSGDAAVAAALDEAEAYLVAQQQEDGSFGGGPGTEASNTNSTALAAVALEGRGEDQAAADAAAWIAERQVTAYSACGTELDGEFGAVAYDDAAITAAEDDGIEVETVDQWRRATAPAITALQSYDDPAPKPAKTFGVGVAVTTDGLAVPGMRMTTTVTGMDGGERYCVYTNEGTAAKAGKASAEGTATIAAVAPTTVGLQPVTVYGERDSRKGTSKVRVLPPVKKLGVSLSASSVKRNGTVTVTGSGLAPLEKVRVYYGSVVFTGKATSAGTLRYSLKVGSSTGKKSVSVLGLSAQRKGTATFTVVK